MLNLKNTLDGYLKNIEVIGNTVQDENNLADIRSVGDKVEGQELYKIPVVSCGKNLFDDKFTQGGLVESTGVLYPNNETLKTSGFIKCKKGQSFRLNVNGYHTHLYDINKNWIKRIGANTFTTEVDGYIRFTISVDAQNVQLEEGTVATAYEPYQENRLEILSPVQLEKIGDVADRIICKDGVWGIEKHIGISTVSREAFTQTYNISDSIIQVFASGALPNAKGDDNTKVRNINPICKSIPRDNRNKIKEFCCWNGSDTLAFCMFTKDFTTTQNFRNSLPVTFDVYYVLETPQFIPLPQDQQVKLRTFAGQTNVLFNTEIAGQIKAQVPKSLGAVVNTHTEQIELLHNALKSVLAGDMYALATILYPEDFEQNDNTEQDIMVIPE